MSTFTAALALIRYSIKGVIRDRFTRFLLSAMALCLVLGTVISRGALTEQADFAVVTAAGALRLLCGVSLAVLICFHLRRCFENREMMTILAAPVTRLTAVFGFTAGYSLIALLISLLAGLTLTPLAINSAGGLVALLLWTATLTLETVILASFGVFIALVLRSAVTGTLVVCGFMALARLSGILIGIAQSSLVNESAIMRFLSFMAQMIALCLPRFDLLAQSAWFTLAPNSLSVSPLALVGLFIFPVLFICAAGVDLTRRKARYE